LFTSPLDKITEHAEHPAASTVEDFLSNLGSGGIWLNWLPDFGQFVSLPAEAFSISAIFSGAGAVILGKFTSNLGALTLPFNYVGLLIGALLANWALAGIHLPLAGDFQAPIIFALAGMTVAGVAMIALMRRL
jgi:hypothetical protein